MARVGRPRKNGERKKCGRLRQIHRDTRWETASTRTRDFGVSPAQATNPLAGYLAGVLYLKGQLSSHDMGHYFSFLQVIPRNDKAIQIREKVQGGSHSYSHPISDRYVEMTRALGKSLNVLHALARDQLTVPVIALRRILAVVPLTKGGRAFITACEMHHPRNVDLPRVTSRHPRKKRPTDKHFDLAQHADNPRLLDAMQRARLER